MKALPTIIAISSIISNFYLHSMNIISHKSHTLHTLHKINFSNSNPPKRTLSDFGRLVNPSERPTILKLNVLAGMAGVALAYGTGCNEFLIPIIPHIYNSICFFPYLNEHKLTQSEQNLQNFIKKNSYLIKHIKETSEEITYLQNLPQHLSQYNRYKHLSVIERKNKIIEFEKSKNDMIQKLIENISLACEPYSSKEIIDILQQYKPQNPCAYEPGFCIGLDIWLVAELYAVSLNIMDLPTGFLPFFIAHFLLSARTTLHKMDISDEQMGRANRPTNNTNQRIQELIMILKIYNETTHKNTAIQHSIE